MIPVTQSISSTPSSRIGPIDSPPSRRLGDDARSGSPIEPITRGEDRVELSAQAQSLARTEQPFRAELVSRIKGEISAGTYDTPERFDIAVRRAIQDASRQA